MATVDNAQGSPLSRPPASPLSKPPGKSLAFDAAGFDSLRLAAQREDPAAVREAAQQFEALLMQRMLKEMRAATPGDGLFDSQQLDSYYELFDKQVALDLARGGGLGLADQLVGQLNSAARHGAAAAERPAQAGSGPAGPADSTRPPARPAHGLTQGPNQGPAQGPVREGRVPGGRVEESRAVEGKAQESAVAAATFVNRRTASPPAGAAAPPAGVTPARGDHG